MTKTPWTPGRWEVEHGQDIDGKDGFFVHVNGAGIWSNIDNDGGVCSLADARLIAEAPAMAEALEMLVDHYVSLAGSGDCGFWEPEQEPEIVKVRAILARIKGEPQ